MTGAIGPGAYVAGLLGLGVTVGCAGASSTLILRRLGPTLHGAPRLVGLGLGLVAGVLVAELVPLTLGVLTRLTVPLTAALTLGAVTAALRGPPAPGSGPAAAPPPAEAPVPPRRPTRAPRVRPGASAIVAAAALLGTATAWLAWLSTQAGQPITGVDALAFHLPGVIRFIQSGSLWQTTQYLPLQAQGNYPQNGDLLLLALALPWHSLAFVRYAGLPLLALTGVAVYAAGRELQAPAPASAITALAVLALRPILAPALVDVLTDPAFLTGWSAGTLFLLRHARTHARSDLLLAGLGLGIALGTKWYGLTDVPALIVVWVIVRRPRVGEVLPLVGVIALAGGVWLVRNLILTGNPVFDYRVSLLGATIFPAPPNPLRASIGFDLAHYATDPDIIRHYIWPVLRADFGLIGALLVAGAAAAAILARRGGRVAILAGAALLCAIAYALTPYGAQGFDGRPVLVAANTRYGAPALILAAPLLAVVLGRLGRPARIGLEAVLLIALLAGLHRYIPAGAGRTLAVGAVAIAAGAILWVGRPGGGRPTRPARAIAGLTVAVGLAAAAYHYASRYETSPYRPADPTVDYVLTHDPAGTRIAITGEWTDQGLVPVAPLFGPRLSNTVEYLGRFAEHRLTAFTERRRFVASLHRGRFALLEIGTGFPPSAAPPQAFWALSAGYRVLTRSTRLILMAPGPRTQARAAAGPRTNVRAAPGARISVQAAAAHRTNVQAAAAR